VVARAAAEPVTGFGGTGQAAGALVEELPAGAAQAARAGADQHADRTRAGRAADPLAGRADAEVLEDVLARNPDGHSVAAVTEATDGDRRPEPVAGLGDARHPSGALMNSCAPAVENRPRRPGRG
jgi:hypothetical protein